MSDPEQARRERALAWTNETANGKHLFTGDLKCGLTAGYAGMNLARFTGYLAGDRSRDAEIARLQGELREAESAIRNVNAALLNIKHGEPREALWILLKFAAQWALHDPAVVRALARGGK